MKQIISIICMLLWGAALAVPGSAGAAAVAAVERTAAVRMNLTAPVFGKGKTLQDALRGRKSTRTFSDAVLTEGELSAILWSAWGINRPDGRRTIPTAMNRQAFQVYVVLANGVWLYDAAASQLVQVLEGDFRSRYGNAPLTLLYAGSLKEPSTPMHAGAAYQNVALYCASAGLGNVVKTTGIKELEGTLPLPQGYGVVVVQSIGRSR